MAEAHESDLAFWQRISTRLLLTLSGIAFVVIVGLAVISVRLFEIRADLGELRENALPRLVKLAQLSQEASATSSIAPALSLRPTRSEFDTLLSRITDKQRAQRALIEELAELSGNQETLEALKGSSDLLIENLESLTEVVSAQLDVSQRLEESADRFRTILKSIPVTQTDAQPGTGDSENPDPYGLSISALTTRAVFQITSTVLDPNAARFARNSEETQASLQVLAAAIAAAAERRSTQSQAPLLAARELLGLWASTEERLFADKKAELANRFRIRALAEENSLIANRLLSTASNEFWRASADLAAQVRLVNDTTQFALALILAVILAFSAGNFLIWHVLQRRVFTRLNHMLEALQTFAERRTRTLADERPDEIGEISKALAQYMHMIDQRESDLAGKTQTLEHLSNQLAKYLSPQVYDSIFTGKQEVTVASSRKKLTIFFSDIAGFTETADRLESEELTQLLNHYLTEMSRIALDYGATVDKYVGDAILIFFGDPETQGTKEDATLCVRMAIEMRQRMRELEDLWRESGIEKPLKVRMGIHTGYCTVGNFGSEDRMDYTIVGGAVNIASRLESLAAPGEILISYETFALVNSEISCEASGSVDVRGIAYPVATYKVVDSYARLGTERQRFHEAHAHVQLDLDLAAMTTEERAAAGRILRHGLELLGETEEKTAKEGEDRASITRG